MELLILGSGVGLLVCLVLLFRLLRSSIDFQVSAFAALLGGYRAEGWPRGLQEEDRDGRWGRPVPPARGEPQVPVIRLRPDVRARL